MSQNFCLEGNIKNIGEEEQNIFGRCFWARTNLIVWINLSPSHSHHISRNVMGLSFIFYPLRLSVKCFDDEHTIILFSRNLLYRCNFGNSINENKACRCMQLNLRGDIASAYYFRPKRPMRVTTVHVELLS